MNTIYSNLKEFRLKNGYTQREIGEELGTSTNMYQKYEYKKVELPVRHAKKLGELYKIDWWILYEEDK